MKMIRLTNHTLSFIKRYFRRFLFVFSVVLLLVSPHISYAGIIGGGYDHDEYLKECKAEEINKKHEGEEAKSWPLRVIVSLNKALYRAADKVAGPIVELSKIILILGAAIWLAMYFLKSVSSLATQDSAKVLDGAVVFVLKVAFVYVLINSGIDNIVGWIITPLLSTGMDIGVTVAQMVPGG